MGSIILQQDSPADSHHGGEMTECDLHLLRRKPEVPKGP